MNRNLLAEMARAGFTIKELASLTDIKEKTFSIKVKGRTEWILKEMLAVQKVINEKLNANYTLDYLFEKF